MVQLLSPDDVKRGPSRAQEEQGARIRDMAIEEGRLTQSISILRVKEADERDRITRDVAEFRTKAKVEVGQIDISIAKKKKEVEQLEERRADAMKPIEEVRREADERNSKSKEREQAVATREEEQARMNDNLTEMLEKADDRKQEQDERDEDLDQRETNLKAAEEAAGASSRSLSEKWADFHLTVHVHNEKITARENAVIAGEKTNEIARLENEKRAADYKEKDREIADRYATLTEASKEIIERELKVKAREAEIL